MIYTDIFLPFCIVGFYISMLVSCGPIHLYKTLNVSILLTTNILQYVPRIA